MSRIDDPRERIEYLRESGLSDGAILQRLLIEGWTQEALATALAPRQSNSASAPVKRHSFGRHFRSPLPISTTALAMLTFAALGFSGYTMYRPPMVYSISLPLASASTTLPLEYGALATLSDVGYYENVKASLVTSKVPFIDADLSLMRLRVYTQGVLAFEVPIVSKGKPGSWWETPAGIYRVQSMEKNHFSSFGKVYQPWSIAFQGNFYIHGWPYYEDGTPVASTFSGGCIRLATEDAERVYGLVSNGMTVVVHDTLTEADTFDYQLKTPPISATAHLVADARNGTVLSGKHTAVAAPIASISKLVAALVATEYINLDKTITVPEEAIVYTSVPRLKVGSEVRVYDLLYLLLQESSNEAAETLAAITGRDQFIRYMNGKAKAINLTHTIFSDPSGAKGDYATPQDLFTLLRYIRDNRGFVFGITSGDVTDSAYGDHEFKNVKNFNIIKNAPAKLLGGKVGQTREASETYAGIFEVDVGGEKREIAVIVLGSRDAEADVRALLSFVHKQYAPGEISSVGQ